MTWVIGHRGAAGLAPENTLLAVRRALDLGVDGVEVDVQVTRDGFPVVFHDRSLDRLTPASGYVRDHTLAELRAIIPLHGEAIPLLDEVLDLCRDRARVMVEIKGEWAAHHLAKLLPTFGPSDRPLVASFNHRALLEVKTMAPGVRTIALLEGEPVNPLHFLRDARADIAGFSMETLSDGMVETCQKEGTAVIVWTVDLAIEMRRALSYAPLGIVTNRPDLLLDLMKEQQT